MPNVIAVVDKKGNPWKKITAKIHFQGGGWHKVQIDGNGEGRFSGKKIVEKIELPGETINKVISVTGSTTFTIQSSKNHS